MEPDLIHKQSLILYRLRRQARSDDDSIFWVDARHSAYCCRDFGLGFAGHKVSIGPVCPPGAVENNCFRRPTEFCESFRHSRNMRPARPIFQWRKPATIKLTHYPDFGLLLQPILVEHDPDHDHRAGRNRQRADPRQLFEDSDNSCLPAHFRQELLVQLRRAATVDVPADCVAIVGLRSRHRGAHRYSDQFGRAMSQPFRGIVPGQLLAAMPCNRSSSQEIRWFLIEPTERG
jgi:hypothetical protein